MILILYAMIEFCVVLPLLMAVTMHAAQEQFLQDRTGGRLRLEVPRRRSKRSRGAIVQRLVLAKPGSAARLEHRRPARPGQPNRLGWRLLPGGCRLVPQDVHRAV